MIPRGGPDWERTAGPEAMTNTIARPKQSDSVHIPHWPLFTVCPASRIFDRPQNKLHRCPSFSASAFSVRKPYLVRKLLNLAGLADDGYRERARGGFIDCRFQVCRHLQQVGTLFGDIRRAGISSPGLRLSGLRRRSCGRGGGGGFGSGRVNRREWKRLLRLGSNQSQARRNNQHGNASKKTETSCPGLCPAFLAHDFAADWFHWQPVRVGRIRTSKTTVPAIPADSLV